MQNDYAALFVALIGEGPNPQGVVSTSEGKACANILDVMSMM